MPRVLKQKSLSSQQPLVPAGRYSSDMPKLKPGKVRRLKRPAKEPESGPPYSAVEASRIVAGLSITVSGYLTETSKQVWCKACYDEISPKDNGYPKELKGAGWAVSLYDDGNLVTCTACGRTFKGSPDRWYKPWI